MILVVGSTGVLGTEICRLLRDRNLPVRAMVRKTSAPDKKESLKQMGAELCEADLKDSLSLSKACEKIQTIISTATSIVSRQEGDSLSATDQEGHLQLIQAASDRGVERFVFISFPPFSEESPLQSAKRATEERLRKSGLKFTILQPTFFQEVWLGPHLGFDAANGKARIYGSGKNRSSWISFRNVAEFAVQSLTDPQWMNAVIPLGGPDHLNPLEVVRIFEEVRGKSFELEFVPEEGLRAQYESAVDPVQKTFTALMLGYATGQQIDTREAAKRMNIKLRSVRDFAANR